MGTRDDCICAPLDPEPDCPYHGNRTVFVPSFSARTVVQEDMTEDGTCCAACGEVSSHKDLCPIYAQNQHSGGSK